MRPIKRLNKRIGHWRGKFFLLMGERAYRRNRLDRAEDYLLRSARALSGQPKFHILMGSIALRRGDMKNAWIQFKTVHYLQPELKAFAGIPLDVILLIFSRLEEAEKNVLQFAREWSITSNFVPLSFLLGADSGLGDFKTIKEYNRFQKLPPISEQEIKSVDIDELLHDLTDKDR